MYRLEDFFSIDFQCLRFMQQLTTFRSHLLTLALFSLPLPCASTSLEPARSAATLPTRRGRPAMDATRGALPD
jgi:hypothetical protein